MRERCSVLSELPQARAEVPPIFFAVPAPDLSLLARKPGETIKSQELSHERFNQSTFYTGRLCWLGYSARLGASATGAGVGQRAFCERRSHVELSPADGALCCRNRIWSTGPNDHRGGEGAPHRRDRLWHRRLP